MSRGLRLSRHRSLLSLSPALALRRVAAAATLAAAAGSAVLVLFAAFGAAAGRAHAQDVVTTPAPAAPPAPPVAGAGEIGRVFAASKDAVVRIYATERYGMRAGTGFFIDPHGTIYTHSNVGGQGCWDVTVEFANQRYPAICLLSDPRSGVALLKIEAATPFLPLGNSDAVEIATPVLVIGYPADLPASPSSGIVAGIDQKVLGEFLSPAHIRASLLVQPGEQGAPMLNMRGEVVGLVAGRLGGAGACYALPIKAAEKLRRDFARFGEPRPGWMGMTISPPPELVNDENTETRVGDLAPDSPAAEAGLRASDVLLQIGDIRFRKPSDIYEASFYLTGGDDVRVSVLRDGEKVDFDVPTADHPMTRRYFEERRRQQRALDMSLGQPGR